MVPTTCQDGDENGINFVLVQSPQNPLVEKVGNTLQLATDDPNDAGTLSVTLQLEPALASVADPVEVTYTINLNRCRLDEVSTTTLISDFDFTIG